MPQLSVKNTPTLRKTRVRKVTGGQMGPYADADVFDDLRCAQISAGLFCGLLQRKIWAAVLFRRSQGIFWGTFIRFAAAYRPRLWSSRTYTHELQWRLSFTSYPMLYWFNESSMSRNRVTRYEQTRTAEVAQGRSPPHQHHNPEPHTTAQQLKTQIIFQSGRGLPANSRCPEPH